MNKIIKIHYLFTFLLFLGWSAVAGATEETYSVRKPASEISEGLRFEVIDGRMGELDWGTFKDKSTSFIVKLGIDERVDYGYINAYTAVHATLRVEALSATGEVENTLTQTISVSYSPVGGDPQLDLSVLKTEGFHRYRVTLEALTLDGIASLPDHIYLEGELTVDRYYPLSMSPPVLGSHFLAYDGTNTLHKTLENVNTLASGAYVLGGESPQELEVYWSYVEGAEEYELEWTWVDNYDQSASELEFNLRDFELNNTRIITAAQTYRIPLIYAEGFILYRVRAVGRWVDNDLQDTDLRKYGAWTTEGSALSSLTTSIADWPHRITISADHEGLKNWQYQAVYAEEGKKKEIVSYFDGSLRNRQTVTRINSNNEAIVGENIYDNQGRSAIQILPTPVGNAALKYHPYLNRKVTGDGSVVPYTHNDFDWENESSSSCVSDAAVMSTASGASHYYALGSNAPAAENNWQDYVPDAEGFPFVQVEYTPDNTGRIRRQSGVGADYQITSEHATRYYYLQPQQAELDRLFGYHVGNVQHYKKNLVIDANGQVSVSYIDPQGRVIATALAGDNTGAIADETVTNLMSLQEHATGNHTTVTTDLLNKLTIGATDTDADNNEKYISGAQGTYVDALSVNTQYPSIDVQTHVFNYSVTTGTFSDACMPDGTAYPFAYRLGIDLKDDCGESKLISGPVNALVSGSSAGDYTGATGTTYTLSDPSLNALLATGAYTLTKMIQVDPEKMEEHLAHYLANLKPECLPEFLINTTDCDDELPLELQVSDYDLTACFISHQTMLSDLMPGGQYASLDPEDRTSIFHLENVLAQGAYVAADNKTWRYPKNLDGTTTDYIDENGDIAFVEVAWTEEGWSPAIVAGAPSFIADPSGTTGRVHPEDLEHEADFIAAWEGTWAEALVVYHPEFPYTTYTKDLCELASGTITLGGSTIPRTSESFNLALQNITSFDAANSAANSFGGNLLTGVDAGTHPLLSADPYFVLTYPFIEASSTFTGENTFKNNLMAEILTNYKGTGLSMWNYAVKAVECGTDLVGTCLYDASLATVAGLAEADRDQVWNFYKQLYLSEKRKIDQVFRDIYAINYGFYNGYIGIEAPELPNLSGFLYYDPYFDGPGLSIVSLYTTTIGDGDEFPWMVKEHVSLFAEKVRRFEPVYELYDPGVPEEVMVADLEVETDAGIYAASGECPNLRDLGNFLESLTQHNHWVDGTIISSTDFPWLTEDLYTGLGGESSGSDPINIHVDIDAATATIKVTNRATGNFTLSGGGLMSTITISNPTYGSWSEVIGIRSVYYLPGSGGDGSFDFQVLAKMEVAVPGGTEYREEVLTGLTPLAIGECFDETTLNEPLCDKDENLAQALKGTFMSLFNATDNDLNDLAATNAADYLGGWYIGSEIASQIGDNPLLPEVDLSTSSGNTFTFSNTDLNLTLEAVFSAIPTDIELITGAQYDVATNVVTLHYINTSGDYATFTGTVSLENTAPGNLVNLTCMCENENTAATELDGVLNELIGVVPFDAIGGSDDPYTVPTLHAILEDSYTSDEVAVGKLVKGTKMEVSFLGFDYECALEVEAVDGTDLSTISLLYNIEVEEASGSDPYTATALALVDDGSGGKDIVAVTISSTGAGGRCFKELTCECAAPRTLALASCTDQLTAYNTVIEPLNTTLSDALDWEGEAFETFTTGSFCDTRLAYAVDAYLDYISAGVFAISSPNDDHYLSLSEFSATLLNHYYADDLTVTAGTIDLTSGNGIADAVELYKLYLDEGNPYLNWNNYVSEVYLEQYPTCLPVPMTYYPSFDFTIPCEMYTANVDAVNAANQLEIYMNNMAENFRERYLAAAVESLVENFTSTYADKEYHYTLYYYDQAGNLIQTVPPKGVDRIDQTMVKTNIDAARAANSNAVNAEDDMPDVLPVHELKTQYHYNSLNQLVWQKTPDGGESYFGYDELGRLVVSQNAKQRLAGGAGTEQFSYTRYDELGRIVEVGEMTLSGNYGFDGNARFINSTGDLVDVSADNFPLNLSEGGLDDLEGIEEVTRTQYDELKWLESAAFENYSADNTRNRITGVYYYAQIYDGTAVLAPDQFDNATFYDYDVHGNVKELIQRNNDQLLADVSTAEEDQTRKKISYDYDLVSGNVKQVTYQKNKADQFIHQYEYDADNRITNVHTSRDEVIWEQDAKYFYYDHGPLARTEIGDKKVQASDFAYTIQGWLKGVNSENLSALKDQGKDAHDGINKMNGKDVYGYSLHYYENDYTARHGNDFLAYSSTAAPMPSTLSLYNGNIREMYTAATNTAESNIGTNHTVYQYDQLNRIVQMNQELLTGGAIPVHEAEELSGNYESQYTYDANGNLEILKRWADNGSGGKTQIDDFTYHYKDGTNQLNYVADPLGTVLTDDLANQATYHLDGDPLYAPGSSNYHYDEIGQLIHDKQEEIAEIQWKVTGKVHRIIRETGSSKHNLEFDYDAMGNRITKIVTANNGHLISKTYYIRDAQGNVMSVYTLEPDAVVETPAYYNLSLTERNIYGSSRVGTENINEVIASTVSGNINIDTDLKQVVGDRRYELANHLGNVLEVITDRKLAISHAGVDVDYYVADVVSQSDYYPFGMQLINRTDAGDNDYRYKFNGKEDDPETYGNGNIYDYGFRIYNPRLGKFLSVDPLTDSYPWYTPYQFAGNTPIMAIDLDGLEEFIMIDQGNGYYKAIWDIKARERGQANTIQYISTTGDIVQQVNRNGDLVNFRTINSFEVQNKFIDNRRKISNKEGANSTANYIHYTGGSTRSDGYPHTAAKSDTGIPQAEPNLKANTLIPPPPPVIITNPNTGGTPPPAAGPPAAAGPPPAATSPLPPAGPPLPPPLTLNAQFNSWTPTLTNQGALQRQTTPVVAYLLANPNATITITTNAGAPGNTSNDWGQTGGGFLGFGGTSLGQLADNRNAVLRMGLITQGVSPNQIIVQRGRTDVGAFSSAVVNPPPN